jgi:cytochrome c553
MNTDWPKLAGQNQKYLYDQLKHFKYEERNNALMMTVTPYLKTLKDEDLLDIAAYYESNDVSIGQAKNDEDLLYLGKMLYRSGNMKKEIPACSSCHSVYGDGNSLAGYPSLAGQQIGYTTSTLKAYRSKERNEGEGALVMQSIAENLSDNEIDALANYIHGLYK